MTTWAVLPVKPYCRGKSRLRECLEADEMIELNRFLFEQTFHKLRASNSLDKVLVVSQDDQALDFARLNGGIALQENAESSLNAAVAQALQFIMTTGPGRVLILPADLPYMTAEDLEALLTMETAERAMVIVPDTRQLGTNAILLSNANMLKPQFGRRSFQKHIRQATSSGAELIVWLNENIQQDLDTPQDFSFYNKIILQPTHIMKE